MWRSRSRHVSRSAACASSTSRVVEIIGSFGDRSHVSADAPWLSGTRLADQGGIECGTGRRAREVRSGHWRSIEAGQTNPTVVTLVGIARALNVEIADLFVDER